MNAGPATPGANSPVTASRRRILARTRLDFWLDALGLSRPPSREALLRLGHVKELIKAGVIRVHSDDGFNLADTGNLIRTCEIEAVLAAVVIMVSVIRRRRRRMRRTAASA
jgi:hypothetical protein